MSAWPGAGHEPEEEDDCSSATLEIHLLGTTILALGTTARAEPSGRVLQGVDVQKLANGILGAMSYTVAPDDTKCSLAINNGATSNPGMAITQVGGGFTVSKSKPVYLEGNAAYARYDPVFLASDGVEVQSMPVKWNSVSATGGVGGDFQIAEHWVARPIFNFTLGYVASDPAGVKWHLGNNTDLDFSFLDGRPLKAYGLRGSPMLDYENFAPEHDDDLEVRYTNVQLRSYSDSAAAVVGHAKAESASIWARRRVPTG